MSQEQNDPLYKNVGQRIKERRKQLNISQVQMAELMDVSYQLIQKYESGSVQISLSRILQFATILNVGPEYFYEGLEFGETIGKSIESDIIQKTRTRPFYILLVDDSASNALLFNRALANLNPDVKLHCINDPEQVHDFLNHHQAKYKVPYVDIIVLDINMPKINGLQLLKEIKSARHLSGLPVIMLTNSVSKKEMDEAYRSGCAGFVQKAFRFDDFRDDVENMIRYWSHVVVLPERGIKA